MKKEIVNDINRTDWNISQEDFDITYAKSLAKSPKRLKAFKKRIIDSYNKNNNIQLFLLNLKIIAVAERKMSELAKTSRIERSSIYKILSKDSNPSIYTIISLAHNLGIDFKLKAA